MDDVFRQPLCAVHDSCQNSVCHNRVCLPYSVAYLYPLNILYTGLLGARSEISGPNVYKISGQFQDIFVSFTRLNTQKVYVFSVLIMLSIEADQYCSPKNVIKALL